jgi:nitric oxide reductase NorE protein
MWFFIMVELVVFGLFFAAYAFARSANVPLFNEYQATLDLRAGFVNTLALITASYLVVRSVAAIRVGAAGACTAWLLGALGLGGVFLVVKTHEFAEHLGAGITLSSNLFYMFYLSLTFFHYMHVILGMIILAAVALKSHRGGYSATEYTGVETGASYWHMVDLVWLILFPLVYVMR